MCTAATYQTRDFYMGRTLDYEFSYGEEIVITPRRFPLTLRPLTYVRTGNSASVTRGISGPENSLQDL